MVSRRTFLIWWIGGLAVFAIVIWLGLPLAIADVPGGILDHQAAATAANVNAIHAAWEAAGVFGTARTAMVGDLIFIGIYGIGSVLGGLYFRAAGSGLLRHLGTAILLSAMVFLLTDYGETIAQFMQLSANTGSDDLAGFAATLRPIKVIAWIATFVGILTALVVHRKQTRSS